MADDRQLPTSEDRGTRTSGRRGGFELRETAVSNWTIGVGLWHEWTIPNRATPAKLARSAALSVLVEDLGRWAEGPAPLHRQLARALAGAIERGRLARGARLPAERTLSAAAAVSRGTVVAAYDLLVADGLVERRRGSGTYVLGPGALGLPSGREGSALVHRLVDRSAGGSALIDLSISVLSDSAGLPAVEVRTADLAAVVPDTGYSPWGISTLRELLADHVSGWGLPTTPDEVVITTGAQQAISAAAACWVRPGDEVVVEDPTYPGAVAAFAQAGARLVGVRVDTAGVVVDDLRRILARRPALVYLQPRVQSPTGVHLAAHRREELADLLAAARVPVVEDLALSDLAWTEPPPPLAAAMPPGSVAVVGSLSKLLWGGLRLGFVRASPSLALRFARVKATHDLGSSVVSQLLAHRMLTTVEPREIARRRQAQLRRRYETLAAGLGRELPEWTWDPPAGGLSMWVRLPTADAEAFSRLALHHGVAVATSQPLSAEGRHPDRLRLSFAPPEADLETAVVRLAAAWAALAAGPEALPRRYRVGP